MTAWQGHKRGSSNRASAVADQESTQSPVLNSLYDIRSKQTKLALLLREARDLEAEIMSKLDRFGIPHQSTLAILRESAEQNKFSISVRRNSWR